MVFGRRVGCWWVVDASNVARRNFETAPSLRTVGVTIPIGPLRTRLRALLKELRERRLPRRSSKPRIGTYVVNVQETLRLVVQAGMSDELWRWLMDHGWRVEPFRPDRREYRDIPASYVTLLVDADPTERDQVMAEAAVNAQRRAAPVRW